MHTLRPSRHAQTFYNDLLQLPTEKPIQFIDLTQWVAERVRRSGVGHGLAHLQVLHTTAAIVVNENEPLLLDDFKTLLEHLALADGPYGHDDPERRRVNLLPDERPNGCAHSRALLLGSSKLFTLLEGRLELGRWQSILLAELDGPRKRSISLTIMGDRRSSA